MESKALFRARKASLENILFNVEQHRLDNDRSILSEHNFGGQYASAIYCPSMNKILHLAGRSYTLVSNEQLISPVYDRLVNIFGSSGIEIECLNEDDRRFYARFILKDKVLEVTNKDYLNAMIEIQNSYDGSLRHSISLSFYRLVCSNGMMGWRKEEGHSLKHNSDFLVNLTGILKRLDELDERFNKFRKLNERVVTGKELNLIMETIRKPRDGFPKKILPEVTGIMYQEATKLKVEPNAWLLYNGFNNLLNHDPRIGLTLDVREKIDRDVLSAIRYHLSLN